MGFSREAFNQPKEKVFYSEGVIKACEIDKETEIIQTEVLLRTKALYGETAYKSLEKAFTCVNHTDMATREGQDNFYKFKAQSEKAIKEMENDIQESLSLVHQIKMLLPDFISKGPKSKR